MIERLLTSFTVAAAAYLVSTALVGPVRRLATRYGVIDLPGPRKSHTTPVPLLGGLAVFGALVIVVGSSLFLLPLAADSPLLEFFHSTLGLIANYPAISAKLWALFAGVVIVTGIGVIDDAKGVAFPPVYKFGAQIAAALVLLPAGIYIELFHWNTSVSMLLSVVWIVGITNSFNLLDNMDGLSSGIAMICAAFFLVVALVKGEFFLTLLLAAIMGSTLGFFQFNIRGGQIFLGDTGSLLLGYLLGTVSVMVTYMEPSDRSPFPVLAPVIILALPLFDTFSVIAIRLRERRPVFQGDQMHLSHRLVRIGMTKRQAVHFNYLLAFALAGNALLTFSSRLLHSVVALFEVLALAAMVSILMSTARRRPSGALPGGASGGSVSQPGGGGAGPPSSRSHATPPDSSACARRITDG